MYVSNIKEYGRDIGHADAGRVWHTDMSYTARDYALCTRSAGGQRRRAR